MSKSSPTKGLEVSAKVRGILSIRQIALRAGVAEGFELPEDGDAQIRIMTARRVRSIQTLGNRLVVALDFRLTGKLPKTTDEVDQEIEATAAIEREDWDLLIETTFQLDYDVGDLEEFDPESLNEFEELNGMCNVWT